MQRRFSSLWRLLRQDFHEQIKELKVAFFHAPAWRAVVPYRRRQCNQSATDEESAEREGHRFEIACNGTVAIQKLFAADDRLHSFDAVLMDVPTPEYDGYQGCPKKYVSRRRTGALRVAVIALTAHSMEGDRERCLQAGVDGYTTKPVVMEALAAETLVCLHEVQERPS